MWLESEPEHEQWPWQVDVLLELCDRILVLCGGKVSGIVDARSVTKEQIGYMMTHVEQEAEG